MFFKKISVEKKTSIHKYLQQLHQIFPKNFRQLVITSPVN